MSIKYFWITNFVLALIFVGVVAFAWNNPPGNPPTGSGAIATDASNNVGVGTVAPSSKLTVRRSSAGTAFSVRDTADAADVFTINAVGQVGLGMVPGATTKLGIGSSGTYPWPLYLTGTNSREFGIEFPSGATTGVNIGTVSAHRLWFVTSYSTRMTIDETGRIGVGINPSSVLGPSSAKLSVFSNTTMPSTVAPTVLLLGSSDGTTGGSSIRARGTASYQIADLTEYVRINEDINTYEPGDILEIDINQPDMFKKSDKAYGKKLAGIVSKTGSVILGEEGVEFDENFKPKNHVQLALVGRVPVKVVGEVAIGDAITSSNIAGIGMKAMRSGRVVGFALESHKGEGTGYVKILINTHYWIAE